MSASSTKSRRHSVSNYLTTDTRSALQGAKARCGADTNDYPQVCKELASRSYPAFCRENMSMCPWKSAGICVVDFVRRIKGRSSHRVQIEFPTCASATGAAFLGSGLLLHHERQHHGRCHTSVSSGARTYRRQPVGIQFAYAEIIRNPLNALPLVSSSQRCPT